MQPIKKQEISDPKFELSLIIPTYNEKEIIKYSIIKIFKNLRKFGIEAEVVVVDDSKDGTDKILVELAKSNKSLKLFHRENSQGLGSAIRLGLDKVSCRYAIIFMSDAPDDVKYIPSILKNLGEGYDIVNASRFMKGSKIVGYPPIKTIANRLCNYFVRFAFLRLDLKDFTNSFKGFRVDKIKKLDLEANDFDIGLEITLKAIRKDYKIIEVPVIWKERDAGKSKLRLSKQGPKYIKRILKIFFSYW